MRLNAKLVQSIYYFTHRGFCACSGHSRLTSSPDALQLLASNVNSSGDNPTLMRPFIMAIVAGMAFCVCCVRF